MSGYNLENEFGWVLDAVEAYGNAESPEEITHYGVKGMKWGKRKNGPAPALKGLGPDKITRTTKYGEEITITKDPPPAIAKLLGKMSSKYRENYDKGAYLTIKDSKGKSVGDASVVKRKNGDLYLNWLGVDKSARGKGYASAVMKAAEEYGKTEGVKKMILEVPGNAPDAKRIYENMGFKYTGKVTGHSKDFWGGLSSMEYVFPDVKHGEENSMDEVEDFLAHYGVTGMKWGKRKGGLKARATGAAKDSLQRRLTTNKEIAEGRGQKRDYRRASQFRAGGVVTAGRTKSAAKRAGQLEGQLKRLETGKLKARDVLSLVANTPATDLVVSRQDKRGLPGSVQNKQNTGKQKAANIVLGVGSAVAIASLAAKSRG